MLEMQIELSVWYSLLFLLYFILPELYRARWISTRSLKWNFCIDKPDQLLPDIYDSGTKYLSCKVSRPEIGWQ